MKTLLTLILLAGTLRAEDRFWVTPPAAHQPIERLLRGQTLQTGPGYIFLQLQTTGKTVLILRTAQDLLIADGATIAISVDIASERPVRTKDGRTWTAYDALAAPHIYR